DTKLIILKLFLIYTVIHPENSDQTLVLIAFCWLPSTQENRLSLLCKLGNKTRNPSFIWVF
ncbi:MAG: hypothetical protein PX481_10925, partial [Microcystis sp. M53603_WE2]|uniref:hypothetical protein n=1 Tax=Microcystis sp. M53603_WE2 TaxID=3030678 RepID=UPI00258E0D86